MDSKKILIIVTVIAVLLAGYFAFQATKGPGEEEQQRLAELEASLAEKEALAAEEAKRAASLEEARRLAEEAAAKAAEAEAARLEELAAQMERERKEKERLAGVVSDLNQKTESIQQQQQELQDALARARMDRERAAEEAAAKLREAQQQIANAEAGKQEEIQKAREEALAEAIKRMEARADDGGYTPATEVVSDRRRESINAFMDVQIDERNYRNNVRRVMQRREAGSQ